MTSSIEKSMYLEDLMPIIRESLANGNCVTFSPKGTSMLPLLRQERDRVVLSPLPERLKKYDVPLYRRDDGQYVLHRVVKVGETYTCMGDNQFYPETGLRHSQMIALMTAFTRSGRRITVDSFAYRLYCRFWCISRPVRRLFRSAGSFVRRTIRRAF